MSATCVLERIALALKAKLETLVTSGVAAAVYRPQRGGRTPPKAHKQIILVQETPTQQKAPHGFTQWAQPFRADLLVIPDDTDTTAVDSTVNEFRAKVEKALLTDPQFATTAFAGAVIDTAIKDAIPFDPSEKLDGVSVVFEVAYRHRRADPYSWT